ncbi:CotH kinase family protein [Candidatus Saccharibacteria bacterium]|nr:CotH kinase family protein [Candidatus Saccharibacteria bacterium]
MKNRKWLFVVGAVILVAVIGVGIGIGTLSQGKAEGHPDRGLPIVELGLNGVSLIDMKEGDKDTKYAGNTVALLSMGKEQKWEEVEVKGRGNATWGQEKKPWQLKFAERVNFLDMGRNRKWVLLANYLDSAYIRNVSAMEVMQMLGMRFSPEGEFVELYVDGEYEGLYLATRKTEVGRGSVDLRDPAGVLVELDNIYGHNEVFYTTQAGSALVLVDEVDETMAEQAMRGFLNDFNRLEIAAEAGDWAAIAELVDTRSFAEYFLLSEMVVDVDAYFTSQYFYKDGEADKIHAGPGWDFDMTFGNENWAAAFGPTVDQARHEEILDWPRYNEETDEWEEWQQYGNVSKVFFQLMEIPEFQAEVKTVWQEKMAGRKAELLIRMRKMVDKIWPAMAADAEKWGRGDFEAEIRELLDWVRVRYDFMEEKYGAGAGSARVL